MFEISPVVCVILVLCNVKSVLSFKQTTLTKVRSVLAQE